MSPPVTNTNSDFDHLRRRLFGLISKLSYSEILELVETLESKIRYNAEEKRKHPRRQAEIEANITVWDSTLSKTNTHKISFREFIQNISKRGVFIETTYPFRINKRLSLTFSLPGRKDPINIKGKIVGIEPQGIGVKFDEPLAII
jgi:Tfp pilus assembly protein PilZ